MNIYDLERVVMQKLLSGDNVVLKRLREQYDASTLADVEETGSGFYFTYENSSTGSKGLKRDIRFGDTTIRFPGTDELAGALLLTEGGFLRTLELYCYGDAWPEGIESYDVQYVTQERDLSVLDDSC